MKYLLIVILLAASAHGSDWKGSEPCRVIVGVKKSSPSATNRVVKTRIDFAALMTSMGSKESFTQHSLRVEALDGDLAGQEIAFRFDHKINLNDQSYQTAGDIVFVAPDPKATRFAIYFGSKGIEPEHAPAVPLIGDGDLLRIAGKNRAPLDAPACYPCIVDFDGDGRRDIVGSDRYGTGSRVAWYRNIGTDPEPLFSEREIYRLQTEDGKDITNPNQGWLLTVALCDWDGDGKRDLLVGGWCRYLNFHKNLGSNDKPVFATARRIFDAKVFPGLDYGPNPDTPYQGTFIEPCDWDGDGDLDLLCGTYLRAHIYLLPNTGQDADGLPILGQPVAIEADGKEIDYLNHVKPSVADWDGDGDLDLMGGQYYTEAKPWKGKVTGIYYFENIGNRTHPKLAAGKQVRDSEGQLVFASFHSEPTMVDWNKDGQMDLLVSGTAGTDLYLRTGTPADPQLQRTTIPSFAAAPCRVPLFAYPLAYDLDGDDMLDLVVADCEGFVNFFKGLGSLKYAPATQLTVEGRPIDEEGCPDGGEGHLGYIKVAIADWNSDGYADLVMWSNNGEQGWRRGWKPDSWSLKFFAGTANPMDFLAPVEITAAGKHIVAGYRCKPDVADLDGDGLLDLVVACGEGAVNDKCTMMFLKNIGTRTAWKLAAPVPLTMSDSTAPTVPVRTAARLVDWDGDGDLDLYTGNHASNGVRYWENLGTKTKPAFASPLRLDLVNDVHRSHHEVGIDAVDLDRDGSLDLIIGNGDSGMIHFFRRAHLEAQLVADILSVEGRDGKKVSGEQLRSSAR